MKLGDRCRRGHLINQETAYIRPDNGNVECRPCRVQNVREARDQRRAALPETQKRFRIVSYPDEMTCRTCGKVKPLGEFPPRNRKDAVKLYRNRSCRPCVAAQHRDYELRTRYGISAEDYDRRLAEQGGVCGLCGREPEGVKPFSVDHEHSTNRVRGIVCQPCNVAIGFFETRIDVERMREYLSA